MFFILTTKRGLQYARVVKKLLNPNHGTRKAEFIIAVLESKKK
jgi:hypothetical protein